MIHYESTVRHESACCPGTWFRVRRMSLGRRLELSTKIRDLLRQHQFAQASDELPDQVDAARLALEIERTYLEWGLYEVGGLEIDGVAADVSVLVSGGPEELVREVLGAVKRQCGLSEDERKN